METRNIHGPSNFEPNSPVPWYINWTSLLPWEPLLIYPSPPQPLAAVFLPATSLMPDTRRKRGCPVPPSPSASSLQCCYSWVPMQVKGHSRSASKDYYNMLVDFYFVYLPEQLNIEPEHWLLHWHVWNLSVPSRLLDFARRTFDLLILCFYSLEWKASAFIPTGPDGVRGSHSVGPGQFFPQLEFWGWGWDPEPGIGAGTGAQPRSRPALLPSWTSICWWVHPWSPKWFGSIEVIVVA